MDNEKNRNSTLVEQLNKFQNENEPLILLFNKGYRKDKYKHFQINLPEKVYNEIAELCLKEAIEAFGNKEVIKYDFEKNDDDLIQKIDKGLVIEGVNIDSKIVEHENAVYIDKKTDFKNFDFVVFRYFLKQDEEIKTLTIYKKYYQPAKKFKKAFKCCFIGDEVKELDSDVLYFDERVDVLEFDNSYYVFNLKAFNSIFDFREGFNKIIESKREEFTEMLFINDADSFINDCKDDGRYNHRLCKAMMGNLHESLGEQKNITPNFLERFGISLELDENDLIEYRSKEDINEILNILMRKYAFDGLSMKEMLISGIEKYIK